MVSALLTKRTILKLYNVGKCFAGVANSVKICSNIYWPVYSTQLQFQSILKVNSSSSLLFVRNYAKSRDKKKEKGKTKVEINESQISEVINLEILKNQMQNAVYQLKDDFVKHLSLRSSLGSIEMISVSLDGKEHTLQELAQIVRKNPKTLVVNMAVFPQAIPAALKAIQKAGMNLNPQQDGTTIYIPIPKVTKEHREILSKNAKQHFVKCRDIIRDIQIKHIKQVKRKEKVSEDLQRSVENQLVSIANGFISEAETILLSKQKELTGS